MQDQTPEIVASADLSPISPRPVHTSSPLLVPSLQVHADNVGVVPLERLTADVYCSHRPRVEASTMATNPSLPEVSDTIVVAADYDGDENSQDESVSDVDSFDAYGEDDEDVELLTSPDARDGAQTSATRQDQGRSQGDVSAAALKSIDNSSAPDLMTSAVPAAASIENTVSPDGSSAENGSVRHSATSEFIDEAHPIQPDTLPSTSAATAAAPTPAGADAHHEMPATAGAAVDDDPNNAPVDLQALVDNIMASAASATREPAASAKSPNASNPLAEVTTARPAASLPPKPALSLEPAHPAPSPDDSQEPPSSNPFSNPPQPHSEQSSATSAANVLQNPAPTASSMQSSPYVVGWAPGTSSEAVQKLAPPPSSSFNVSDPYSNAPPIAQTVAFSHPNSEASDKQYESFLTDERRYMAEGKWEKFPDGSRIFIGNLHSDRVSKRDVFELFYRYGRIAQISLKSAYGFVQYHTVADAQDAMRALEGQELKGRKIHLEQSRTQKKGSDRDRSPADRNKNRGSGKGGDQNKGHGRRQRDDYRPGRDADVRRDDHRRDGFYGRDRAQHDTFDRSRGRSRSPPRHGRRDADPYRRRSPSPYGRSRQDGDELDIPRRYGSEVPDVQLLLMQDLHRDFINWVLQPFQERGLKAEVMFLNPRMPRDAIIKRQVLEGVHGVIELDGRAQTTGKITLQVFDRSAGMNNVRFDQYQDLEPRIAAELVLRAKTTSHQHAPPAASYQGYGHQVPPSYGTPQAQVPTAAPGLQGLTPELAGLLGQMDPSTLQTVLASLQGAIQSGNQAPPVRTYSQGIPSTAPVTTAANPQVDINALLGTLKSAAGVPGGPSSVAPAHHPYGSAAQYPGPHNMGQGPNPTGGSGGSDSAQQVQNIMAQLARYR